MFMPNEAHRQTGMFDTINELPDKQLARLEISWASTFYQEAFMRIDEDIFAVLYSDKPSRPNVPINTLVGLEILKYGCGWTDNEMHDNFTYNVQVRYALGCRDLATGHFELRTMYNFRRRMVEYQQETGENLFEKVFEQITDEQLEVLPVKTNKLRKDSTLIMSNIRQMTRIQLLVEVLQRTHRMLSETDQEKYQEEFEPYLKGSSGQYIYNLKDGEYEASLEAIGKAMQRLEVELAEEYAEQPYYKILQRVFEEHYIVEDNTLRPKQGQELKADSLQSPDDWEATFRNKRGENYQGYTFCATETCNPENPLQLIVSIQTEPNNTDDAKMLEEDIPNLKERTDVDEMYIDGGFGSPDVDEASRKNEIELFQSAIRGRQPSSKKLYLSDFTWEEDEEGRPAKITCPNDQETIVEDGRKEHRYLAYFDDEKCANCACQDTCPTVKLKTKPYRVLRFSKEELGVAKRRKNSKELREKGENLRSAVEATMRSVKHSFGEKLSVRGHIRVSMAMAGSSTMTNMRRIHRYRIEKDKKKAQNQEKKQRKEIKDNSDISLSSFLISLIRNLRGLKVNFGHRFTFSSV